MSVDSRKERVSERGREKEDRQQREEEKERARGGGDQTSLDCSAADLDVACDSNLAMERV